ANAENARNDASATAEAAAVARADAETALRESQAGAELAGREKAAAEARAAGAESAVGRGRRFLADAEAQHDKFVERRTALATRVAEVDAAAEAVRAELSIMQESIDAALTGVAAAGCGVGGAAAGRGAGSGAGAGCGRGGGAAAFGRAPTRNGCCGMAGHALGRA
uniref:hypothetical protein n=1 Tax=Phenylobacterium sp. TaxID=1871053 RepID=UPI002FE06EB7